MKYSLALCTVGCLLVNSVDAQPTLSSDTANLERASLPREDCGFKLTKKLAKQVKSSKSTVENDTVLVTYFIDTKLSKMLIEAKLSFSCFGPEASVGQYDEAQKSTAREEIAFEDLGGRYARNVVWEKKYKGENFGGTIAYVNSIFGDGTEQRVPDFFLICPDVRGLACFSFEILKPKLKKGESEQIPNVLGDIADSRPNVSLPAVKK